MITIRLSQGEWEYDSNAPLGKRGGFGQVFLGQGNGHDRVAVKKLHLSANDAAHRELEMASELARLTLAHVIPVLDAGQDASSDSYFVVMPCAEKSLQDEIAAVGAFSEAEAVRVLQNIATGLAEVRQLVHRDLKPANILFHEGRWKIADFGIARFVEESTSLQTLKECLSPQYAAPEQWKYEHAMSATDIYALGCIAYALLTAAPPFKGSTLPDFRNQHLNAAPAALTGVNPRLASLVSMMLRKQSNARPNIDRVLSLLSEIASDENKRSSSGGLSALAQAGAADAAASLQADAMMTEQEARNEARRELADAAINLLKQEVIAPLFSEIQAAAPSAKCFNLSQIELGSASLVVKFRSSTNFIHEDAFRASGWDVIAGAIITVQQGGAKRYEWSANLWYTNLGKNADYRWWEVMYMTNPLLRGGREYEPYAIDNLADADSAAAPAGGKVQLGARPHLIDDENVDDFCERWADLLAQAYRGQLRRPSSLPLL